MEIRYKTQRLSYRFFISMLIIFAIQILFGLLLALIQMDPDLLKEVINFNVVRAFHLTLGIIWIVLGFIGTILFVGPLLGEREVKHRWIINFLLVAVWVIVGWTAFTLPLAQHGIAGWVGNHALLQQGKEYLEAGQITDLLLLIGFSIFVYLTLVMFPKKVKNWNEMHWGLAIGVCGLAAVWVFSMVSSTNLDTQEYFRWYVVHYWVEAVWEVIHITLIGFLLYKFFGADEKEVGFAVFWGVSLVILSGLIGNSHHYFWIGTPAFWQFWGSLFSALEPLPLIFCLWHVYLDEKHGITPIKNRPAFYYLFGSALFESVGAGILGFTMTMAYANIWEHGTWLTAAHGHMALFGAFGLLVIGAGYEAARQIKGITRFKDHLSKLGFWLLFIGLLGILSSFVVGGTEEIYVYRILGLDWWGHHVRPAMELGRVFLGLFAFLFTIGAIIMFYDLVTLKNREISDREQNALDLNLKYPDRISPWKKAMSSVEFGLWFVGLWFFGLVITAGVFSFNLHSVRLGDPTIPYVLMLGIGYPGLVILTIAFAVRFLRAFEQRQDLLQTIQHTPVAQLATIDLRSKDTDENYGKLIMNTFNQIHHGQSFFLIANNDLKPHHITLFEVLGPSFVWEDVQKGPDLWKARVGKVN